MVSIKLELMLILNHRRSVHPTIVMLILIVIGAIQRLALGGQRLSVVCRLRTFSTSRTESG